MPAITKTAKQAANGAKNMTKIGNAIAARRAELGLNQTELATAAGMSQKNISKLELGQTAKPQNWRMLAKVLKIDEAEFAKIIDESAMELGRPGKRAR
jgi:transcriptional regulator with XRE-family HTH domain